LLLRKLSFEKEIFHAQLCSPQSNFAIEMQPIEYRRDPLTGFQCRINVERAQRVKQEVKPRSASAEDLREMSRSCSFCSDNIEAMTPCFPVEVFGEKRLRSGSAVLFPNLYPFGEHHGVAVFSEAHSLSLDEFSPEMLGDCLKLCVNFSLRVYCKNPKVRYGSINWNYMPPAGASIAHPHLQVVADRRPTRFQETFMLLSEAYYRKHGSSYWQDLIDTECELQERLIDRNESATWLASYAPHGNNEVLGVFPQVSSIAEINEATIEDISVGISRILRAYYHIGVESLNMSLISGPTDRILKCYALNLRINSRPNIEPYYTSDCGFMERIQLENIIETRPEEVAERLRNHFMTTK
jgi:UDPglucose--hexose-1-phosphate uridylyltransferase